MRLATDKLQGYRFYLSMVPKAAVAYVASLILLSGCANVYSAYSIVEESNAVNFNKDLIGIWRRVNERGHPMGDYFVKIYTPTEPEHETMVETFHRSGLVQTYRLSCTVISRENYCNARLPKGTKNFLVGEETEIPEEAAYAIGLYQIKEDGAVIVRPMDGSVVGNAIDEERLDGSIDGLDIVIESQADEIRRWVTENDRVGTVAEWSFRKVRKGEFERVVKEWRSQRRK